MYRPVLEEFKNCEPPRDVQQSTNTTIPSGQSPCENIASRRSIIVGSNGVRLSHMSAWPVNPWITYTDGTGPLALPDTSPGERYTYSGRRGESPSGFPASSSDSIVRTSSAPSSGRPHGGPAGPSSSRYGTARTVSQGRPNPPAGGLSVCIVAQQANI